ncbi:MAG TPA: cupin domain-containing protein [Gammaproteobacteria bacterium]|nr:cupin domain-containing protein [Gammaproteobacteria bacterium]
MTVEHWDPARDGELGEAAMARKLAARGYHVSRYVYPPGTVFPEHTHAVDKIDAVLAGRFRLCLAGRCVVLEAGDCIAVPAGMVHSAEVLGDQPVISLDAVREPA